MSLKKIQKDVDEWMAQYKEGYWPLHAQLARLMEEVGELAREINHVAGPKKKKVSEMEANLADELADVFFTLTTIANSQGIDLDDAWQKVMSKYYERDSNRWTKK